MIGSIAGGSGPPAVEVVPCSTASAPRRRGLEGEDPATMARPNSRRPAGFVPSRTVLPGWPARHTAPRSGESSIRQSSAEHEGLAALLSNHLLIELRALAPVGAGQEEAREPGRGWCAVEMANFWRRQGRLDWGRDPRSARPRSANSRTVGPARCQNPSKTPRFDSANGRRAATARTALRSSDNRRRATNAGPKSSGLRG